jgi:hypothetical protein
MGRAEEAVAALMEIMGAQRQERQEGTAGYMAVVLVVVGFFIDYLMGINLLLAALQDKAELFVLFIQEPQEYSLQQTQEICRKQLCTMLKLKAINL